MTSTKGVYAILDVDVWRARGVEVSRAGVAESIADALAAGGARTLQLRAKNETPRATLEMLRRLRPLTRDRGVSLVANDRPDLALLADADAVHVGQDDLPLSEVARIRALSERRIPAPSNPRIAPRIAVGISTHDLSQLDAALASRPAYVAFGPVFPTKSKRAPDAVVGLDRLAEASVRASRAGIALVAIGGVTMARARSIVECGVRWAAVIGELVVVDDHGGVDLEELTRRARAFTAALEAKSADARLDASEGNA